MGPYSKETFHFRTRTATTSGDVILSERLRCPRSYQRTHQNCQWTHLSKRAKRSTRSVSQASRLLYSKEAYTESVREFQSSHVSPIGFGTIESFRSLLARLPCSFSLQEKQKKNNNDTLPRQMRRCPLADLAIEEEIVNEQRSPEPASSRYLRGVEKGSCRPGRKMLDNPRICS